MIHCIKCWLALSLIWSLTLKVDAQNLPPSYICYQVKDAIVIDGVLDEESWEDAEWTEDFQDIEGDKKPKPKYRTHVKMLWDNNYFYFAAELEEPHIWATISERDEVMFQNDDFEIFLDPDGDGVLYLEYEMNALNAVWDLLMLTPYRSKSGLPHYVQSWDIRGLQSAVKVNGTINTPSDSDSSWTIEIAMPWEDLVEVKRGANAPKDMEQWRVNFSRVDWWMEISDGKYQKKRNPISGKVPRGPQENWVWSPTGIVDIHLPEDWGYVQFSKAIVGTKEVEFVIDELFALRKKMMEWYFAQYRFFKENNRFTDSVTALTKTNPQLQETGISPNLYPIPDGFIFQLSHPIITDKSICLNQDGRYWVCTK